MKILKTIALITMLVCTLISYAQKQANIWYFGSNAGLDFNNGNPTALTDGSMFTQEGCASISDENGNLLFYTDGLKVWNKNHQSMPNGTGLLGNYSSTQSAIIVPKPNSNNIYYIFTVDYNAGPNGLCYSEVNMSLNNGLGDITTNKNISLTTPVCEKITSVIHDNGTDIWVITHAWNSDAFYAYLISENGVALSPVVSNAGTFINGNIGNSIGYLKAAPNGKRLAIAHWKYNEAQLFDFNNSNGIVSNPTTLSDSYNGDGPYGVEFSPSGDMLYIAECAYVDNDKIYQYDLNASDIPASQTIIGTITTTSVGGKGGALQLGPDGKIYVAAFSATSLGVINKPNLLGASSDFTPEAISLMGKKCYYGLPPFIQSYFYTATISAEGFCLGEQTSFSCIEEDMDEISWDFGDPSSGINNIASGENTTHFFNSPGQYTITMTTNKNGVTKTEEKIINIYPNPEINIEEQYNLCNETSITIDASYQSASYIWSDQTTEPKLEVFLSGQYSVTVTSDMGCQNTKNVIVNDGCGNNAIYLPSAFSPNNDGVNDILYVRGTEIQELDFSIYNRFGELVFSSDNTENGWDGIYAGQKLNNETYMANIIATFNDGEKKQLYGNVTIVL